MRELNTVADTQYLVANGSDLQYAMAIKRLCRLRPLMAYITAMLGMLIVA